MMEMDAFSVTSRADGTRLSVRMTLPEGVPRGLVEIAHGMCEYKERYLPFMEALTEQGYVCLINDHRGHGNSAASPKDYGFFGKDGAAALVEDLKQMTDLLKARFPGLPLCLFGHSMGSLAVRDYAGKYDDALNALVVCGCPSENPAAGIGLALVKFLEKIKGPRHRSPMIYHMVSGGFVKSFKEEGSRFAWLNSDPAAVRAYERDEKCGFMFTLNGYEALLTLMKNAYDVKHWKVSNPDMPVLFISGQDDPCMINRDRLNGAVEKMRSAGYRDVSLKVYPGMRHEVLEERGKETVFSDILKFLEKMK